MKHGLSCLIHYINLPTRTYIGTTKHSQYITVLFNKVVNGYYEVRFCCPSRKRNSREKAVQVCWVKRSHLSVVFGRF